MTEQERGCFKHKQLPGSLELAFVGDSVYDLYVRSSLVTGPCKMNSLNRRAVEYVNAHAQSESLKKIEAFLSDEEAEIVRRAKNARQTPTKNAMPFEYHNATALEALIGFLYLVKRYDRLFELLRICVNLEE